MEIIFFFTSTTQIFLRQAMRKLTPLFATKKSGCLLQKRGMEITSVRAKQIQNRENFVIFVTFSAFTINYIFLNFFIDLGYH